MPEGFPERGVGSSRGPRPSCARRAAGDGGRGAPQRHARGAQPLPLPHGPSAARGPHRLSARGAARPPPECASPRPPPPQDCVWEAFGLAAQLLQDTGTLDKFFNQVRCAIMPRACRTPSSPAPDAGPLTPAGPAAATPLAPRAQWSEDTIPFAIKLLGVAAGQSAGVTVSVQRALPKVETTAVPAVLRALRDRCAPAEEEGGLPRRGGPLRRAAAGGCGGVARREAPTSGEGPTRCEPSRPPQVHGSDAQAGFVARGREGGGEKEGEQLAGVGASGPSFQLPQQRTAKETSQIRLCCRLPSCRRPTLQSSTGKPEHQPCLCRQLKSQPAERPSRNLIKMEG